MLGWVTRPVRRAYHTLGRLYLTPILRKEWEHPRDHINERPVEFAFAMKWLSELCPGDVLDVGTGLTAWPHLLANCGFRVTAIDQVDDYWRNGCFNRHFYVQHDDITSPRTTGPFDLITCISVLEHIPNHRSAVKGMFGLLRPGGHLLLTFPYCEHRYVEDAYALPGSGVGTTRKYVCQVFSRTEVDDWLKQNGGEIVDQQYYDAYTGDLWTLGERIRTPACTGRDGKHHLTCVLIRKA